MSILNQAVVSIRHYSQLKPLACTIVNGNPESFFTVKFADSAMAGYEIIKGDPIIYGAMENDNFAINGGNVIAYVEPEGNIVISPDKVFNIAERRQYERFPVSLFGSLTRHASGKKRFHAYIKDMSYSGFRLYSEVDLNVGDSIEVDIFLHNSMLNVAGTIMRKSVFYGRNEYGIQIVFRDKSAIYATQEFLDKLLSSETELLRKQLVKNLIPHSTK